MVAKLAQNTQPANNPEVSTLGELQKLREYCRRLNQALEAERAKTSKLRQYIARFNNRNPSEVAPAIPQTIDTALQTLVEDQTRLLEQLYSENQKQLAENQAQSLTLSDMEHKIQQLLVANDKLKARNIELRRQLKPTSESRTARPTAVVHPIATVKPVTTAKLATVTKSSEKEIPQVKIIAETAPSEKPHRWFRFSLKK